MFDGWSRTFCRMKSPHSAEVRGNPNWIIKLKKVNLVSGMKGLIRYFYCSISSNFNYLLSRQRLLHLTSHMRHRINDKCWCHSVCLDEVPFQYQNGISILEYINWRTRIVFEWLIHHMIPKSFEKYIYPRKNRQIL